MARLNKLGLGGFLVLAGSLLEAGTGTFRGAGTVGSTSFEASLSTGSTSSSSPKADMCKLARSVLLNLRADLHSLLTRSP